MGESAQTANAMTWIIVRRQNIKQGKKKTGRSGCEQESKQQKRMKKRATIRAFFGQKRGKSRKDGLKKVLGSTKVLVCLPLLKPRRGADLD